MKDKNDLQVEKYDEEKAEITKKFIIKRLAMTGAIIAVSLNLFFVNGCPGETEESQEEEPPIIAGGAGAWYYSRTTEE